MLLILLLCIASARAASEPSLIPWGNFSSTDGLPAGWELHILGAPARAGHEPGDAEHPQVARLDASEQSRSSLQSPAIAVAPGEVIRVTGFVKVENVPEGGGNVMLITECDGVGVTANQRMHKIGAPVKQKTGWQDVSGEVTVPPAATTLRLHLGFTYSNGTCWWDGISVHAIHNVVVRPDVVGGRLSRESGGLPLVIINRAGEKDLVSIDLSVLKRQQSFPVQLDGSAEQHVTAPFPVPLKPGPVEIEVGLHRDGEDAKKEFHITAALVIPPPVGLPPVTPTAWLLEDGNARIEGNVDLSLTRADLASAQLSVRLVDAAGNTMLRQPISLPLHDRHNAFSLQSPAPLPLGNYEVVAELTQSSGQKLEARQPWSVIPRSAVKVTLNADGYLVHNGKTIFPLGLFNGGGKMEENAKAGFTISHAYNDTRVFAGVEPDDQAVLNFMDSSLRNGMEAVTLVPLDFGFHGQWDAFRQRIRLLRNHPALLVWDEEEGIGRGDMTEESLAKMRQIVQEEDPNHPFIVGDSRDSIQRITDRANFFPLKEMDLGMWWWYPIPAGIHPANSLGGDELTNRYELTPPDFLTRRNTDKPLWVGVQAYKKPGPLGRYPTPIEQRLQAYVSFIHGARGLMWYAGSVDGGIYLDPVKGHWTELKALAGELREMEPVLMSQRDQQVTFTPAKAAISAIIKLAGNRTVLLAANRDVTAVDAEFEIPPEFASATVFREDRQLHCSGGKLRDHFDSYVVHIYELIK